MFRVLLCLVGAAVCWMVAAPDPVQANGFGRQRIVSRQPIVARQRVVVRQPVVVRQQFVQSHAFVSPFVVRQQFVQPYYAPQAVIVQQPAAFIQSQAVIGCQSAAFFAY
jgi:hypothetical protein